MSSLASGRISVDVAYDELAWRRGERMGPCPKEQASIRRRLIYCGAALALAFGVLGIRTTQLALDTPPPAYPTHRVAAGDGPARLVDSQGRALAVDIQATGLVIDGREVWDPEEVAAGVASVFPSVDPEKLRTKLSVQQRVVIDRMISDSERQSILALGLPGTILEDTRVRAYPQGRLFSHVVGYQIEGRGGVTGLEATATAQGLGGSQATTLNVTAQTILAAEVDRAQRQFSAKAAWGVLMNAKTGAVAAMVSLPDFDPNKPGASPAEARRNRVVSDNYELGSAFKAITVAAALEHRLADLRTPVDVTSPLRVGDWAIEDYSEKGNVLTVEEVLALSSNIGTAQLALLLGEERFVGFLNELGLGERLTTSLPEGRSPLLPSRWGPAELATVSYGHGMAVSPLHLTQAFTAMVNGGELITPRFFERDPIEKTRVLRRETSAALRQGLRTVITNGTGGKAEAPGFFAIGKTATADKPVNGRYDDDGPLLSSFIGAFPGYNPEWVLLISLDEPKGTVETSGFATAGWTAAPAFRRAVERLAPVLGVMPVGEDVAADGFLTGVGTVRSSSSAAISPSPRGAAQ